MEIRKMSLIDLVEVVNNFVFGEMFMELDIFKSDYLYVAVQKNEILGILYADATKTGTAIIFAIEVKAEYQRRGIASRLIQNFEKDAVKDGIKSAIVFYNNKEQYFYQKNNFEIGDNLEIACKVLG